MFTKSGVLERYHQSSTMKRDPVKQDETGKAKKRCVEYSTLRKWQRKLDCELQTMLWLFYTSEMDGGKKVVSQLKCKVCIDFADGIRSSKNFSDKWIVGADFMRISNVCDHAQVISKVMQCCS